MQMGADCLLYTSFMSNVIGTEWEMPVVLAGMYGLRMSEIIGLRTFNIDLEKMQFEMCIRDSHRTVQSRVL